MTLLRFPSLAVARRPVVRSGSRPWSQGSVWPLAALLLAVLVSAGCSDTPTGSTKLDITVPDAPDIGAYDLPDAITPGDLQVCPGGLGCACEADEDCSWGVPCLRSQDGSGRCAKPCAFGCDAADTCRPLDVSGADQLPIPAGDQWCVPKNGYQCDPCTTSADCAAPGFAAAACVQYGAEGRFCGIPCQGNADCNEGSVCEEVTSVDRGVVRQCVRKEGSEWAACGCSVRATEAALATTCGLGACQASRSCGEAGLSACDAKTPGTEVCNGLDDDCDGETDEPVAGKALCDDGKPCTTDSCAGASGCSYTSADGQPCDADGSVCTEGDACAAGLCVAGQAIVCSDDNPCTTETCDKQKGCMTSFGSGPCDDGEACTKGENCKEGKCQGGVWTLCNDNQPCTQDLCDPKSGACQFTPTSGGPCDDGNTCTNLDTCAVGLCAGVTEDCDDGDGCTADSCTAGSGCVHLAKDGTVCDDNNACTGDDTCVSGSCLGSPNVPCESSGPCLVAACNPQSGACVASAKPNGALCSDGDLCSQNDTCSGGLCSGTARVCNDGNACTVDSCTPLGGCVTTPISDACTDGNACTEDDNCSTGTCKGSPKTCDDANPCTTDSCNPQTGCVFLNNTAVCDDGDVCTTGDACSGGSCVPGNDTCECRVTADCVSKEDGDLCNGTLVCDNHACVVDLASVVTCDTSGDTICRQTVCEPASGSCLPVDATSTTACDDGDPCTQGDLCEAGSCASGADTCECRSDTDCIGQEDGDLCNGTLVCDNNLCVVDLATVVTCDTAQDGQCRQTACDPLQGICLSSDVTNGTACDDDNKCTDSDGCALGVCVGLEKACDDLDVCTDDSCNALTGLCNHTNNAAPCDDNNVCTDGDTCGGGSCLPGAATDCNDNDVCTDDSCDPTQGCSFTFNTAPCSDGDACTADDTCSSGTCQPGNFVCECAVTADCASKEDGNLCNGTLVCASGLCVVSLPTVISCDTAGDTDCLYTVCQPDSGACLPEQATDGVACDDGASCTTGDACASGNCAGVATVCNDNNVCTDDSCDSQTGSCVFLANTATCTDNDACTVGDECQDSACATTPLDCSDSNPCTDNGCDPQTGCTLADNATACDDGLACTTADVCTSGSCLGIPTVCNDNNVCTDDSCDTQTGSCVFLANAATCTDNDACTIGDQCQNSACATTPLDCSDSNPCTDNGCDPQTGCTLANNVTACDDGDVCTTGDVCAGGSCVSGTYTCECEETSDCVGQEDGNPCNGTLICQSNECVVDLATVITCDTSGDTACNQNVCQPASGLCLPTDVTNGTACSDGSPCTFDDACTAGSCIGSATDCNDGNLCTNDSCDPVTGACVHDHNSLPCDDGAACTESDVCGGGICSGTAKVCNDGNACTDDSCDPVDGSCDVTNNTAPCNDNNACTTADVCSGGSCGGSARVCDDGVPCTFDGCDMALGCTTSVNEGGPCSDDNPCTTGDICSGGSCDGTPNPCDDGVVCTDDECDIGAGCVHNNLTGPACNDNNACTTGDACNAGVCTGTAPAEAVTTLAGIGTQGSANGLATTVAQFNYPHSVVELEGDVYISDTGSHLIRRLSGGTVNTTSGVLAGLQDGAMATARFWQPTGMVAYREGLAVADTGNQRIRYINLVSGTVETLAGAAGEENFGDTERPGGYLDGSTNSALFDSPVALAALGRNLYIADRDNHCVRYYNWDADTISTVVGVCNDPGTANGDAATTRLEFPLSLALDDLDEVLYIGQDNGTVRAFDLNTQETTTLTLDPAGTFVSGLGAVGGLTIWGDDGIRYLASSLGDGRIFVTPLDANPLLVGKNPWAGSTELAFVNGTPAQSRFGYPLGLAAIARDKLLVVDRDAYRLRQVQRSAVFCTP